MAEKMEEERAEEEKLEGGEQVGRSEEEEAARRREDAERQVSICTYVCTSKASKLSACGQATRGCRATGTQCVLVSLRALLVQKYKL